jgi:hypothetical protein
MNPLYRYEQIHFFLHPILEKHTTGGCNMKKRIVSAVLATAVMAIPLYANISYAGRQWNNPENEKRYKNALRQSAQTHQNAATAWGNYDRELGRAQKDVRRVRDEAIKGAIKGGPGGAAWGAAKGSAQAIYERGKDHYQSRRR